jgi:hypothetical protein
LHSVQEYGLRHQRDPPMSSESFNRRRADSGSGPSMYTGSGKAGGKGAWGGYHNHNAGLPNMPLAAALKGLEEASSPSEYVLRCAACAMEHGQVSRSEVETVLGKLSSIITEPVSPQVNQMLANSLLPGALIRAIRRFRSEAPCAALACLVVVRCSGSTEGAVAHIRAGALDEVNNLMDRHPTHGGIQNVSLLMLASLVKDSMASRQAVTAGAVSRVLKAMDLTSGREVQRNGLAALRLLLECGRTNRAFLQDNPRAPRTSIQETALRAKVAHQSDDALCETADDVLALVTPRFKEVMCWHWQSGWCKLGPRCTYAHGQSDLRGSTGLPEVAGGPISSNVADSGRGVGKDGITKDASKEVVKDGGIFGGKGLKGLAK